MPVTPLAYRRLTLGATFLLGFIIVTGGLVRITGSGLGCPDWPTCDRNRLVAEFRFHPMIEFVNRTITGLVSIAVIAAVLGSVLRVPRRRDLTLLSLGLVLGIVAQIVLGGQTVKHELDPKYVMAHFLLSAVILANAVVLHHRAAEPGDGGSVSGRDRLAVVDDRTLWLGRALVGTAAVVLILGTVVTGAGPHSGDEDVVRLSIDPGTAARVHSIAVWFVVALAVALAVVNGRSGDPRLSTVRARSTELLVVMSAQAVIGYTQYFADLPTVLVAIHILGATAVWSAVMRVFLAMRVPAERSASGPARHERHGYPDVVSS